MITNCHDVCVFLILLVIHSELIKKQECIPVGCVPSTAVAAGGRCVSWGDCLPGGVCFRRISASGVPTGVSAQGGVCQEVSARRCLPASGLLEGVCPGDVCPVDVFIGSPPCEQNN